MGRHSDHELSRAPGAGRSCQCGACGRPPRDAAREMAGLIVKNSPFRAELTKNALYANFDAPLSSAVQLENRGRPW